MSADAIATILEEHRSLKAIVHGLKHVVNEARTTGGRCDFVALRAMLDYIDAFAEKRHHPKEETYLFARLRERTEAADAVLEELEHQHQGTDRLVERLHEGLESFERGDTGGLAAFADALDGFAAAMWQHMATEEKVLLPLARVHLTEPDWQEIAQAFAENQDPAYCVTNRGDIARLVDAVSHAPRKRG